MTIKNWLYLVLGSIVAGLVLIFMLTTSSKNEISTLAEFEHKFSLMQVDMLMLRRHEKDFLLRNDDKYLSQFNDGFKSINKNLEGLEVLSQEVKFELNGQKISSYLQDYEQSFKELVTLKSDFGLSTTDGLRLQNSNNLNAVVNLIGSGNSQLAMNLLALSNDLRAFETNPSDGSLVNLQNSISNVNSLILNTGDSQLSNAFNLFKNSANQTIEAAKKIGLSITTGVMGSMREATHNVEEIINEEAPLVEEMFYESKSSSSLSSLISFLLVAGGLVGLVYMVAKKINDRTAEFTRYLKNVVSKLKDNDIDGMGAVSKLKGLDEFTVLAQSVGGFINAVQDLYEENDKVTKEALRIKSALDVCNTSVMMADTDLNINYMNQSVSTMMSDLETDIKSALPNFNARNLIGTNIDGFHKDPSHQRGLLRDLNQTYSSDISVGSLTMKVTATPIFGKNRERLGTVVEWQDRTAELKKIAEEKVINDENLKIAQALEVCNTSVMMADNDLNITYMNKAVEKMMSAAESDIKTALPNFNASTLMGTNIDGFHVNPSHQRGMLKNLTKTYSADIKVGPLTMQVVATPIFNEQNERLGTVVEWQDRTAELKKLAEEKAISDENLKIAQALDVCNTSVMMADNDLNITYMNEAVNKMMSKAEPDIKTALPNFNASTLMGTNIDGFHKDPSHQRGMLKNLTETYTSQIKVGPLSMQVVATPIFNEQNERLGTVVEWLDRTEELKQKAEEKRISDENNRIKQALDNVATNAMVADGDLNIVYMNKSVTSMMQGNQDELKKVLPSFDSNNLVGQNIDQFHKNPAHQRGMLEKLSSTFKTQIEVGSLTFGLVANPVYSDDGSRIGTVVEWNDRTEEVAVEREIDALVDASSNGDLSRRIDVSNKEGFFKNLGDGLNKLVGIAEGVINDTARVLDAMAHGNLNETIDKDYQGSFGKLKTDANATVDKLTEIITQIRDAASSVSTGADEIAQGNADLSQRTEEQASSLEETASSMEEMTSAVRQSAENAGHANKLAAEARDTAAGGGNVVNEAVVAMSEINNASKKISDIIGVIDEIAFQTNLLALNAAVEAARAGEQGRGFAVVAGEVRSLAQRSAGAAKEIKDLIRDSVEKVDAGTELVNKSGATLTEIVDSVQKVTDMMRDITSAAEEQSSGIEQVNKAVSQMDEMTQQNAALVEEATSAGEAMSEQARGMMKLMNFFNTGTGASVSMPVESSPTQTSKPATVTSLPVDQDLRKPMDDPADEWEEF